MHLNTIRCSRRLLAFGLSVGAMAAAPSCTSSAQRHPQTGAAPSASTATATAAGSASADPRQVPPSVPPLLDPHFPKTARLMIANGLELWHAPTRTLPLVHIRLVLRAGSVFDAEHPGIALLTALSVANEFVPPAPTQRPSAAEVIAPPMPELQTLVTPDAVVFSTFVTKDNVELALERLAAIVARPKLELTGYANGKILARKRAASPTHLDESLLLNELIRPASGPNPYAAATVAPGDVDKINLGDVKLFHKKYYAPSSTKIVVVGDIEAETATQLVQKTLGSWTGTAPDAPAAANPTPPDYNRVVVADRPGMATSTVMISGTEPPCAAGQDGLHLYGSSSFAALGPNLAEGPIPFAACSSGDPEDTRPRVEAMIARIKEISSKEPNALQLEAARSSVIEHLVTSVASPPAFADSLARYASLRLEPDTLEETVDALRTVSASQIKTAVGVHVRDGHLIVAVIGDAALVADALARLGDVAVLDPGLDFARKRSVPAAGH